MKMTLTEIINKYVGDNPKISNYTKDSKGLYCGTQIEMSNNKFLYFARRIDGELEGISIFNYAASGVYFIFFKHNNRFGQTRLK